VKRQTVLAAAFAIVAAAAAGIVRTSAQTDAAAQLQRARDLWDQRLSNSAIAAAEAATRDRATAAEAYELLGRIYAFKGWRQDNVFPGWHDEPAFRERAVAALKASLAAAPDRASAREALHAVEMAAAAEKVEPAPPRPEIRALDERLQALQNQPGASVDDVVAAVEARARAQADPAPYFTGAQILIDRGAYDRAIAFAARGAAASDRFIAENLSAYQMSGKSQGSYDRGHAMAADLTGWALFQKKDYAAAAEKLEEASRLYQRQDVVNEYHLGELARVRSGSGAAAEARDHFLNALSLNGGPPPVRQRARQALEAVRGAADPNFDAWLDAELTRRRDARMAAALTSLVDRPLPKLPLTTIDGKPFDTSSLQGKVLLLNFFASW
jgi:hypothetical protein